MKIQIKSRFSASVIFEHDAEENSINITLEFGVKAGANLEGANLEGEILIKTPLQLNNLKWFVLITDKYLRIGCQRFTHDEWRNFSDGEIVEMDFGALKFWRQWKAPIMALADAHAADEKGG